MQRVLVWFLVRELRPPNSIGLENKKPKHKQQKQRCNEFNNDLKNGPYLKKNTTSLFIPGHPHSPTGSDSGYEYNYQTKVDSKFYKGF